MSERARKQKKAPADSTTTSPGEESRLRQHHAGKPDISPLAAPPVVREVLGEQGQPLYAETQAFMESRFGHDFSKVRVHADGKAAESAQTVNATAYTVGQDVVFGEGQYAPGTREGKRLLAHELAHTIQQGQTGEVATPQAKLSVSHPGDPSEQEADAIANQIVAGKPGHIQSALSLSIAREDKAKATPTAVTPPTSDWSYDPNGLLDDSHVNAQFKAAAKKALAAAVAGGLRPRIAEAYRSPEESERKSKAYKSGTGGRAAPKWQSIHNYGLGMDVYLYDADGGIIDSDNSKKHPDWYKQVKQFANTYMSDFVWGEPIADTDHFEYHPNWSGLAAGTTLLSTRDWAQKAAGGKTDFTEWIDYFWWKAGAGGREPAPSATKAKNDTGGKTKP